MNSLCEIIAQSIRPVDRPHGPKDDRRCFDTQCRALLEEARLLGLNLDDVIDALRRSSDPLDQSN